MRPVMKTHWVIAMASVAALAGCKGKDKDKTDNAGSAAAPPPAAAPAEPAPAAQPASPATPPPAAAKMVELDLSPLGAAFKGVVAMVPEGSKTEFDDPSRHIVIDDKDFVSLTEAPGWDDAVKSLNTDKDNKNIKMVSPTEVTYERTPPLGTAWDVDVKIKLGKAQWSCATGDPGTFTSAAMRDEIAEICKSIHKK
jgi:hypothetical protein